MKKLWLKYFDKKSNRFLQWPFFILYYFILRQIFDINYFVIYTFCIILVLLRFSFEICALIFFCISIVSFLLNSPVEANHYMSFVYGFLVLSLAKYFYLLFKDRFYKK